MLSLSGKGKNTCWKMFIKYANLLTKVVCLLNGIGDRGVRSIDDAWHSLLVKVKCDQDVLPPTHGALEVHITRANYQAKIWLQSDHDIEIMDL